MPEPRTVGPDADIRPVNQLQRAANLNASQQQARRDTAPGSGPTREEMLAQAGDAGSTVLPGQFDPLQGSSAYGQQATRAPGSAAAEPEVDTERGGGAVKSDLERQRAMELEQKRMSQARQLASGTTTTETEPQTTDREQAPQEPGGTSEEAGKQIFQAGQAPEGKGASEIQTAQKIASAVGAERTAKALQTTSDVYGNIQAVQKAAKAAKNLWNIIKAGELAAGASVVSLIVLFITANLQMVNKYTLKNKLIPETYLVEDFTIVCTDCFFCGSMCFNFYTIIIIVWVIIGALMLLGTLYGLDYFGVLTLVDLSF